MAPSKKRKSKKKEVSKNFISRLEMKIQHMGVTTLVATIALFFVGMGTIMNVAGLAMDYIYRAWVSGPMPYAGRAEVTELAAKTADTVKEVTKQLEIIDMRQQQSVARGAVVAENLRDLQIQGLKGKLAEAQADALKNPSNAARQLVLSYQAQLDDLIAMASGPPLRPPD